MTRDLLPGRLAVPLVVAVPIGAAALAGGTYSDLALGVASLLVWVTLLIAVLSGRVGDEDAPPALIGAASLLLALLALTALSLSWTNSAEDGFAEAVRLGGYLAVFLLAGLAARPSRVGSALAGIAMAGVAIALLATGSRLLGIGAGDAELAATLPTASGRLSYPIGYWNALGALVVLALPALCWIACRARSRGIQGLALAGFGPPLLAAYMTSSRGALIAAAAGLAVAVALAPERRRAGAAAVLGVLATLPAILAATLAPGIVDSAGDGSPGTAELAVIVALFVPMAALLALGGRLVGALSGARFFALRVRARTVLIALAAGATLLIALAGPSALIGDLRSGTDDENGRTVGIVSASGSGRAQFWSTALDAYATEPVRGIGAGGYEAFWNQNGTLRTPARNAHSEPLELLAELGLGGLGCLVGFLAIVVAAGVRVGSRLGGGEAGPALGIVVAGLVGFLIDWTWQVPAVAVPVLIAGGLLAGVAPPLAPTRPRPPRLAPRALALGIVALAVPALWASGVLAVSSSRVDSSADAFDRGQLDDAAAAARTAASIEPWAAEPWLQLARIELAGDNLPAAAAAAAAAIERAPEDLDPWLVATIVQTELGNLDASAAYAVRTFALGLSD